VDAALGRTLRGRRLARDAVLVHSHRLRHRLGAAARRGLAGAWRCEWLCCRVFGRCGRVLGAVAREAVCVLCRRCGRGWRVVSKICVFVARPSGCALRATYARAPISPLPNQIQKRDGAPDPNPLQKSPVSPSEPPSNNVYGTGKVRHPSYSSMNTALRHSILYEITCGDVCDFVCNCCCLSAHLGMPRKVPMRKEERRDRRVFMVSWGSSTQYPQRLIRNDSVLEVLGSGGKWARIGGKCSNKKTNPGVFI